MRPQSDSDSSRWMLDVVVTLISIAAAFAAAKVVSHLNDAFLRVGDEAINEQAPTSF